MLRRHDLRVPSSPASRTIDLADNASNNALLSEFKKKTIESLVFFRPFQIGKMIFHGSCESEQLNAAEADPSAFLFPNSPPFFVSVKLTARMRGRYSARLVFVFVF